MSDAMGMKRRDFIFAGMGIAAGMTAGCRGAEALRAEGGKGCGDATVFISDLHIGGANKALEYTQQRFAKVVDAILAMKPRPRRVVCFGDVAMTFGLAVDYAVSKPMLKRIEEAGIELHITMGNHDRRSAFFREWPEYLVNPLVPGRCTRVIDLGGCDLVLLDTLKGTDDRAETDMGPVEGTIDAAQLAWFESWVAAAKRPFFVGSHQFRDLYIDKPKPLKRAAASKWFVGWIYGHDHSWCPDMSVADWGKSRIVPTLALPSTGLWGDIGYVVFRTCPGGAVAELHQDDFYFTTPTSIVPRPAAWDARVADAQGKRMHFRWGEA